jgi:tRNA threonylcarbamoyl adenosine modification protein YeaZ
MGDGPPTLVVFDTSAAHCAAAVVRGDRLLASRFEEMGRGQAERLMQLLDDVMAEAGCGWADLDAIGVGIGPGNFTGIRIAVATARGLAMALGVPAIGVSSFEILREGAPASGRVLVSLEAPRGLAYVQSFDGDAPAGAPRLVDPAGPDAGDDSGDASVALALGHRAGEIAARHGAVSREAALADIAVPLARIALRRLAAGATRDRPAPLYVRPADAAPSRDAPPVILP